MCKKLRKIKATKKTSLNIQDVITNRSIQTIVTEFNNSSGISRGGRINQH